jgi:aryl-alcohol dehydrogenase-like predicted oxidoreductase
MKKLTVLLAGVVAFGVLQGCSTPKTAGLDSAYLNKNRGASGAQISRAEARQYRRQQALSADEIRLENMKRRQGTDSVIEGASAANSATSALRNVNSLLKGF